MKKLLNYFTIWEKCLWCSSVLLILSSFFVFKSENYLSLVSSLVGVTSLIFIAKGNPIGQGLMVIFGIIYGIISYGFAYYGEMITYVGMSVPMAAFALITWLRNPYKGNKSEVEVSNIKPLVFVTILGLSIVVTVIFYFILSYFNTANIIPSTVSVATSFIAVSLCAMRSPYFALAYAINDAVLIVLWILATLTDISYLSVVVCFIVFFVNDMYSFINWKKMKKRQSV